MADKSAACTPVDVLNILEPDQSETIDDLLERGKTQRVQILIGTESPYRKGQTPYARTRARITFDKEEALRECVRMLRWSNERLRALPDQLLLWEWTISFHEGTTISFGVNWYDNDFFERRGDAFMESKHAAYYRRFGATPEDFNIQHFFRGDPGFDEDVMKYSEQSAEADVSVQD